MLVPSPEIHFLPLEKDESRKEKLPQSPTRFAVSQSRGRGCIGGEVLD